MGQRGEEKKTQNLKILGKNRAGELGRFISLYLKRVLVLFWVLGKVFVFVDFCGLYIV